LTFQHPDTTNVTSRVRMQVGSVLTADPRAIHIYTDGSCFKNPGGESGCAAIVVYPDEMCRDEEQIVDFGCAESNNNRMELLACISALEWIRDNKPWRGIDRVQIFIDSKYVYENIFRAREWKANDWRNRHGEPKENADLWKRLISAHSKTGMKVHFEWNLGKEDPSSKAGGQSSKSRSPAWRHRCRSWLPARNGFTFKGERRSNKISRFWSSGFYTTVSQEHDAQR
jgi:ribonuclease HI